MSSNTNSTATGETSTTSTTRTNSSNNTGYRGQRTQQGGRNNNRRNPPRTTSVNTFKGTVAEMNGHVFQCYGEATEKNQFARTMEELDGYIGLHFKHNPADIKKMIKTMDDTSLAMPKDHEEYASKTEVRIWEKEVDMFVKQRETYNNNKCALYSVVWGQSSEAMQAKIKSDDEYEAMHADSDSLRLIKVIKGIAYKFESQKNIYLALDNAKCTFYLYHQGPEETNSNYMSKFKNTTEVIEHYGGNIGEDKALVNEELKTILKATNQDTLSRASTQAIEAATEMARNKSHAIAFLKRADKIRYGLLITELENQFTRGTDQYPTNITETYNLLVNYKKPIAAREKNQTRTPREDNRRGNNNDRNTNNTQTDELAFVQRATETPPIDEVQCYNCQQMGHYASSCRLARVARQQDGVQLLQCENDELDEDDEDDESSDDDDDEEINFSFHQQSTINITPAHMIDKNWILIDSESTVNIFSNGKFLRNIRHCGDEHGMRIHSNGGYQDTHMIGDLPGFGPVWYNKGSLANILSLAAVRKICRITMDTLTEAAIVVHKHNGEKMKFTESKNGLYYYNAKATKDTSKHYSFINSVSDNKSLYTRRQLEDAELAK
jgi:hypothetical protein